MQRAHLRTTIIALLAAFSPVAAKAVTPLKLVFTMPAGVDPPTYIYYNGDGVATSGFPGVQLHGGLQLEVGTGWSTDEYEKNSFDIPYVGPINVTNLVDGSFPLVQPWTYTYTASLGTWHICFEFQPGGRTLGSAETGGQVFGPRLGFWEIDPDDPFFRVEHGSVGYFRRDVVPEP